MRVCFQTQSAGHGEETHGKFSRVTKLPGIILTRTVSSISWGKEALLRPRKASGSSSDPFLPLKASVNSQMLSAIKFHWAPHKGKKTMHMPQKGPDGRHLNDWFEGLRWHVI